MLEKIFQLKKNHTTIKTEIIAGITTFMTMAYILAVNPNILGAEGTGMPPGAVFTATALAAVIGTLCMAFLANYPFALAPGMGLNAFFTYTVIFTMGYTYKEALAAVFIEGILFILMSLFQIREAIFNAIPQTLKYAVSAGIGLFITFIGLQNANIVVKNDTTLVSFFSIEALGKGAHFNNAGITVILAVVGTLFTAFLIIKKVKGGILWGILATYLMGIICEVTHIYVPAPDLGLYSLIPDFSNGLAIASIAPIFGKLDFSTLFSFRFIVVIFAFLFVDMFDTLGTLIGVSSKADMLDENGKLPNIKGALLADSIATTAGAILGTSTTTTYVESASGVSEGGRTGLTAFTVAVLFALSLFFSPVFLAIPSFATAPALIIVGFYMIGSISSICFDDYTEGIPAFITIFAMPFMYSISEGIAMGVIAYVVLNLICGKVKEKKISVLMVILAILFILKYIFL